MPSEKKKFVPLTLASVRNALDDKAHFIERHIPKKLVWLPGLDPCGDQRRPVYPAVAVLGRASPPFAALGCISSKAFAMSVPASS